jgi:thymidine kinase
MDCASITPAKKRGYLDCIAGCMKSGKSSELLRRLVIEKEIGNKVLYINSSKDTRCDASAFSTHNPLFSKVMHIDSITATFLEEVPISTISEYDVIGVDEAQFFSDLEKVVEWVEQFSKRACVAGLTTSYDRKKFGKLLDLECYADTFVKLVGYCERCAPLKRRHAPFTHKIEKNGLLEEAGGKDKYMTVCRECYLELNEK